jgi:hypothetical protein
VTTGRTFFDLAAVAPHAIAGRDLMVSTLVREFEMLVIGPRIGSGSIVVGPLTFWSITHDFKLPMVSMCSRGMRELERDRRKHR